MMTALKIVTGIGMTAAFAVLTGCASAQPVSGALYTDVSGPVGATSNPRGGMHGQACAHAYLGLVAMGDASISAAAKAGNITSISHVEQHTMSILGLYTEYCLHVWGAGRPAGGARPAAGGMPGAMNKTPAGTQEASAESSTPAL